ncbi:MAG: hypothetical protein J5535_02210 [Firmicutes bacterium]|nr:hypothetical protein [Bacillota bacterium]
MRKRVLAAVALILVLAIALCACEKGSNDTSINPNSGANSKDYVFKSGSTVIEMKADAEAVLKALGAYKSSYEAPSCAFDGMDKIYSYNGFDLMTYSQNGKDLISGVVLRDDTVETPEGIAIGSKAEDVKKAYGDFEKDATSATFKTDNCKLLIIFDGGVVTSIQYIALVEK